MTANSGQEEICWKLEVNDIQPPTAAHIHRGTADVAGPVEVTFFNSTPAELSGCVEVERDLIKEIRKNPENFYVNVHNAEFPAGAVRGQVELGQDGG